MKEVIDVMDKKVKKLNAVDVGLVKFSVVAAVFVLLNLIPSLMDWVASTNVWWFVVAVVVLGARPFYRAYLKK